MRPVTYYRLTLLLPVAVPLPALAVPGVAAFGLVFIAGMAYYGIGYVVFGFGVLIWLARPGEPSVLPVAALVSPLFFAPLAALNAAVVSVAAGWDWAGVLSNAFTVAVASVVVGLCYAIPVAAVGPQSSDSGAGTVSRLRVGIAYELCCA